MTRSMFLGLADFWVAAIGLLGPSAKSRHVTARGCQVFTEPWAGGRRWSQPTESGCSELMLCDPYVFLNDFT